MVQGLRTSAARLSRRSVLALRFARHVAWSLDEKQNDLRHFNVSCPNLSALREVALSGSGRGAAQHDTNTRAAARTLRVRIAVARSVAYKWGSSAECAPSCVAQRSGGCDALRGTETHHALRKLKPVCPEDHIMGGFRSAGADVADQTFSTNFSAAVWATRPATHTWMRRRYPYGCYGSDRATMPRLG